MNWLFNQRHFCRAMCGKSIKASENRNKYWGSSLSREGKGVEEGVGSVYLHGMTNREYTGVVGSGLVS